MIAHLRRLAAGAVLALAALGAVAAPAAADTYPTRPIKIIVPWPPGAVDVFIRAMQDIMQQELGQPIIIENRAGANGFIGTEIVAKSPPDGYTLLFNVSSSIAIGPLTSSEAHFDAVKDFAPIMNVFETPMVLVTKASLPVKNLDELIAYVRKNPGKLSYGSPGIGSMPHLLAETLKIAGKLDMAHVPYKGFSPMVQALTTDELDMAFISVGTVRPFLLNGKLKLIAIDEGKVTPDLPQVPALTEALPGFRTTSTYGGLFAPAGTPAPIVKQINAAAVKALASPGVNARVAEGGQIVIGDSPEHFAETVRSNVATLKELVAAARAAGAKFD